MTSRQITKEYRLGQWAQIMRARRESGLTVKAWCAENNINEKTYYYWQNKLRQATCEQINKQAPPKADLIPTGWTQITTAAANGPSEEVLTIEIGSSRIRANSNTSPELLAKVCRVLVSL